MGKSPSDEFCAQYEAKLQRAKLMAFFSNIMYGFTWFLGFCALTWASAVILGGLLSQLTRHDYYSVVALLLVEAVRLATTTFFGKLVTLKLIHGSADPHRLVYDNGATQNWLGFVRIFEQSVQLTVFAFSILVPIRRLQDLSVFKTKGKPVNGFDGMETSLRIFYVLVLVNGSIAALALLFSKHVVPVFLGTISLRKYYERIVWMGMDVGLLHATDFEFLSWTFQMQADEYRRNERALLVMNLYEDMMKYLYYYPNYKGFEAAKIALDSSDPFEREAAANIVGLWVTLATEKKSQGNIEGQESQGNIEGEESGGASSSAKVVDEVGLEKNNVGAKGLDKNTKHNLGRLVMQTKLLRKLADALDNDESGRAATSSFWTLAESDPESVLMVRSEGNNEKVADILMDQIHRTVKMGRPNNALMYIKAMIPLLPYLIVSREQHKCMIKVNGGAESSGGSIEHGIDKYCTSAKLPRLEEDVRTIVLKHASGLKRLQAVAAKAAYLFLSKDEHKDEQRIEELHTHLKKLPVSKKDHILPDEKKYLLEVLGESELPGEWKDVIVDRPLNRGPSRLPWLAHRYTFWIASFVTVLIIVTCSVVIMMYAHF